MGNSVSRQHDLLVQPSALGKKSRLLMCFPQVLTSLQPLADGGMEKRDEKGRIWFYFNPLHVLRLDCSKCHVLVVMWRDSAAVTQGHPWISLIPPTPPFTPTVIFREVSLRAPLVFCSGGVARFLLLHFHAPPHSSPNTQPPPPTPLHSHPGRRPSASPWKWRERKRGGEKIKY